MVPGGAVAEHASMPSMPSMPVPVPVTSSAPDLAPGGHRGRARRAVAAAAATALAVSLVAACGDDGGSEALPAVDGPTSPAFEVTATEMAFTPGAVAVEAGDVEVVLRNDGSILHDLRIDDQPFLLEANAGETDSGSVALDPGSYAFFCSIPGHRPAGMEGVLEVR